MHAARITHSKRLQRVLSLLKKAKRPVSTMQIIQRAKVCAVNSIVAELRANGYAITCRRRGDVWHYQIG